MMRRLPAIFLFLVSLAAIAQGGVDTKELLPTAAELNHEFDAGSGWNPASLTPVQVKNLATLGRVWGFLKYHDPRVTAGHYNWDYELFRILPVIADARDPKLADRELAEWIVRRGPVEKCGPCVDLDASSLQQKPDVKWIEDRALLGDALSAQLVNLYKNRRADGKQFYVELMPEAHNAKLTNEPAYKDLKFPDAGYQLLAAFRFWNAVEYWSPDRDVSGEDWPHVLEDSIADIALAKNKDEYQLKLMAMVAQLHDGHANLLSSLAVRPPVGECRLPVQMRFVENIPIVFRLDDDAGDQPLRVGDVVTELDHVPVTKLMAEWKPYFGTSNEAGLRNETARYMTRGNCGDVNISVRRNGEEVSFTTGRHVSAKWIPILTHDRPGKAFQMLSPDVAYLKLSAAKAAESALYVESAEEAKALIIDIRGYPADFFPEDLGPHLVSKETPFVRATEADLDNPGAFHWNEPETIKPKFPLFRGKVIVLVDEAAMSSAEFQAMAARTVPGAVVVGSITAGADGNVSQIPLPGGLFTLMSGLGVFYPDKRPTQRVGIVPDVIVRPTIDGIRSGRDEVLEAAVRLVK
jgi:hypothetical protein